MLARSVIAVLLASATATAVGAQTVGEQHRLIARPGAELRDAKGRAAMRVTLWYPAADGAAETSIDMGPTSAPLIRLGSVAMDAPIAGEQRLPVILLSHGFGGSARVMAWFGKGMAARGYAVVGVDHPGNNGADEMTLPGAILWWERAADLRVALRSALADPAWGPRLDGQRIGVAGFSIGGLTALVAGGARLSPAQFFEFCAARPEDGICVPQIEYPVTPHQIRDAFSDTALHSVVARADADQSLPGVRAVFAMAPVVRMADLESLRQIRIPTTIVVGSEDVIASAETQARVAASLIPGARLQVIPEASHYSFLGECTPLGRSEIPVCRHATVQRQAHANAVSAADALFSRALSPSTHR